MYFIHQIHKDNNGFKRLICEEEGISLAGCNSGIIIAALRSLLKPHHNPPCGWTLPLREIYSKEDQSVIIDIKPNNHGETVLCEIDTVFGYSYNGWTPIMFRLHQLYNENTEDGFDKYVFEYPEFPEIVYTMFYFSGSFKDGAIVGSWNWPGKSSINSLMLYPAAMSFFSGKIKEFDPDFLNESIFALTDL